jgi:hypothetical protein
MVKETELKITFYIKKNKTNIPALSIICARQSRCAINTLGRGWCENGGSESPGTSNTSFLQHLSLWPS